MCMLGCQPLHPAHMGQHPSPTKLPLRLCSITCEPLDNPVDCLICATRLTNNPTLIGPSQPVKLLKPHARAHIESSHAMGNCAAPQCPKRSMAAGEQLQTGDIILVRERHMQSHKKCSCVALEVKP